MCEGVYVGCVHVWGCVWWVYMCEGVCVGVRVYVGVFMWGMYVWGIHVCRGCMGVCVWVVCGDVGSVSV